MTKYLPELVTTLLLTCAIGCSDQVVLDAPIGNPLSKAANADFVGRWLDRDTNVLEIRQKKDGSLAGAALNWDEQTQQFRVETLEIEFRSIGESVFFLFPDDSKNTYDFFRIEKKGEDVAIHRPDPASYRQAIEKNELAGKIESKNNRFTVTVEVNARLTTEFFSEADLSRLDLKDGTPWNFRRIKKFDEPQDLGFDDLLIER